MPLDYTGANPGGCAKPLALAPRSLQQRKLAFALVAIALPAFAAKPERIWQTGTLLDSELSAVYLGTVSKSSTTGTAHATVDPYGNASGSYSSHSSGYSSPRYGTREVEVIESDPYVYIVARVLLWRWNKTADVTVNATVRFAVDRRTMYLLDDEGREHKTTIVKRTLKLAHVNDIVPAASISQNPPEPSADSARAVAPAINPVLPAGQFPERWKSATSPARYTVRVDGDYIYAEQILPDAQRPWIVFAKIDAQKDSKLYGKLYVGKVHYAGGCRNTTCPFEDQIEFTLVTSRRIEGVMLSYPAEAMFSCNPCGLSKPQQYIKFAWVPE